jgi:long-chain acyl-CoA synthetase
MVPVWTQNNGVKQKLTLSEASRHEAIRAEIQKAVDEVNQKFSHAEQIKAFEILDVDLTEASGHLTPSLKIKRAKVLSDFEIQLSRIYN